MSPRAKRVAPVVFLCAAGTVLAQDRPMPVRDEPVVQRGATLVGRPVRPVSIDVDLRDLPPPPEWQPGDPIKEIPRRAYPRPGQPTPLIPPSGPDPLLALQPTPPEPHTRDFDVPIINVDGQNFTGVTPPDTNGDVGPNHFILTTNTSGGTSVRIYDKTAPVPNLLTTFVLDSLAPVGQPCASGLGDPIVLYDQLADRWLLSEFSSSGNRMCVYISKTSDPVTGGWWFYQFQGQTFPDYPKYGVWPDAYYVTTNESDCGVYAFDRVNMLNGAVARPAQRFSIPANLVFGFQAVTPADHDGATPPPAGAPGIVMRHRDDESSPNPPPTDPVNDFVQLWEIRVDWTTPGNSTVTGPINIAVADFSSELCGFVSFSCFPQPSGPALDPLREVVMWRLAYRNFGAYETLVGNFVVDADGEGGGDPLERGGVRWYELRKIGAGPWLKIQEGTFSPDVVPRWMGGIAMDGDGNIAVGYNVTSPNPATFPGLRYTGREASDPPGTLRAEVSLVEGSASNSSIRYGDYSSMSVDPSDDCTFWFTGEYNPLAQWRTRIGAFKFDSCGSAIPANTAVFNATLQAPACTATGRSCDSAALLNGRDTITNGPEPNQPNTINDSCADGTSGTYHVRESIDRIRVGTLDSSQMSPGKVVRVDVTVWGFSRAFANTLDLYYTADANNPSWIYIGSVKSGQNGPHVISRTYTLPTGPMQAVRARYRYLGDTAACGAGQFDDHDDLAFAVQ